MGNFFVYIIYSKEIDKYYVGHSADLDDRVFRHTNSGSKATKKAKDWTIVYKENIVTKSEAYRREMEIKKRKAEDILNVPNLFITVRVPVQK